jgi:hypothetical protein
MYNSQERQPLDIVEDGANLVATVKNKQYIAKKSVPDCAFQGGIPELTCQSFQPQGRRCSWRAKSPSYSI